MLTRQQLLATVDSIAAVQLRDGMIPWFPGGHADAWNHVEAAMALTVGGRRADAERAYEWLVATQRADGAWHQYYRAGPRGPNAAAYMRGPNAAAGLRGPNAAAGLRGPNAAAGLRGPNAAAGLRGPNAGAGLRGPAPAGPVVEVALLDANVSAYVATGAWHYFLATRDTGFLASLWRVVDAAMGFVLALQAPGGEVIWARHPDGTPWSFALLTASSSTCFSLRCAIAIADRLGLERPQWRRAAAMLAEAIAERPRSFLPKDRWAMDWYYPVLVGVVQGEDAEARLAGGWNRFVMEGLGARCVSDRPWVTTGETCEAVMAHVAAGRPDEARRLFAWAQHLRAPDGSYFTGMVHPERAHFPGGERTTYSAAAAVLAADALDGVSPASGLFLGRGLPTARAHLTRSAHATTP